jgi:hypothetical protein
MTAERIRSPRAKSAAFAVYAVMATVPSPLSASSCNDPIVAPIKFQSRTNWGQHKWTRTHFFGKFCEGHGTSTGAAGGKNYNTRADLSWTNNDRWQINIEGSGRFQGSELGGVLLFEVASHREICDLTGIVRNMGAGEELSSVRPIRV